VTIDKNSIAAEFKFDSDSGGSQTSAVSGSGASLLEMGAAESHPIYGSGLYINLHIPTQFERAQTAQLVMAMNLAELREFTRSHMLGSWCLDPLFKDGLSFISFLSNDAFRPGLLANLAMSLFLRAQWAAFKIPRYVKSSARKGKRR
jgi:hypothetical protein